MFNRATEKLFLAPITKVAVAAEVLTIPAGAAGTVVDVQFNSRPIYSANNGPLGGLGDSSITFVTGTCFVTEVSAGTADAALGNGEYWVDYAAGMLHGRKATNAITDTVSYVSGAITTSDLYLFDAVDNVNDVLAVVHKPLAVSTYTWSVDQSAALEASSVIKAAPGVLRSISGRIDSTLASATYYVQLLNATALPADGVVTNLMAPLKIQHTTGTDTRFTIDFTENGLYASIGMVLVISSTEFTKTITAAAFSGTILYK